LFVPHTPLILKDYDYFEVLKNIKKQLIDIAKQQ
jgi:predicted transcriptional regulator